MSVSEIAKALEKKLQDGFSDLPIAWENVKFDTPDGPYQVANILYAEPENPAQGDTFFRQRGFLQVSLQYPIDTGKGAAMARAELLRDTFHRGLSLTVDAVTTIIEKTPEIGAGRNIEARYVVIVRIRFFANIETSAQATNESFNLVWAEESW
jgi:hypothetical protein